MKKFFSLTLILLPFWLYAQDAFQYYNKGIACMSYGDYTAAIQQFTSAINLENNYADVYQKRGDCYFELQQYEQAIQDYLQDEKISSNRSSYNLARTYARQGQTKSAIQWLETHLKSQWKLPESEILLDKNFTPLQNTTEWKNLFSKEWWTWYEKSLIEAEYKITDNQLTDAIEILNKLISSEPNKVDAYFLRANAFFKQNELKKALSDYDYAIKINNNPDYYIARARVFKKLKKYNEAINDYNQSLNLTAVRQVINPNQIPLYLERAETYQLLGQKEKAIADLKFYINFYYKDDKAFYQLAKLYSEILDYQNALTYLNSALQLNPAKTCPDKSGGGMDYLITRAQVYYSIKDYKNSFIDYSNALDLNPNLPQVYFERGNIYLMMNDYDNACSDWNKALKSGHKQAEDLIKKYCQK